MIGAPAFKDTAAAAGLELLDGEAARDARAVLVSGHRDFDYEELLTATLALQGGAMLFATSRDPTLPMPGGAWPGTGSVLAAIETASGAVAEIGGKPERHLFELACERIPTAGRVAMVGDRIASDIEGGRRAGLATVLVLSGASTREKGRRPTRPPTTSSTTSPRCSDERRRAAAEPAFRPGLAFAGVFAVTFCGLFAVGAVLPVLPRYVHGPLDGGNVAVGIVVGSYAATGLLLRPVAGRYADRNGRRPTVLVGSLLVAPSGFLYLLPLGIAGLIAARLVLGAGEGTVFTAGSAWIVDLAPEDRRGRVIGLYGLAVWAGLSIGPLVGELLLHASGYTAVWLFAGAAPLVGAAIALRVPDPYRPHPSLEEEHHPLIAREAVRPGAALALGSIGYACVAAFVVLHLDARGVGHGAAVFGAFATMVVLTRLVAGDLPDRVGPARVATGAALAEAVGLVTIGVAQSLPVAIAGALAMGTAFSLLYPSLSLIVVERIPETRRGAALGTFTAFFDAGVGLGAPLAGAAAALTSYEGAFLLSAAIALVAATMIAVAIAGQGGAGRSRARPASAPRRAGSGRRGRSARGGRRAPTRRCRSRSAAAG